MTRLEKRNAEIRKNLDLIFDFDETGLGYEEIPARELINELMGRTDAYHLMFIRLKMAAYAAGRAAAEGAVRTREILRKIQEMQRMEAEKKRVVHGAEVYPISFEDFVMSCAEPTGEYGSNTGLVEELVEDSIRNNDGAFLALVRARLYDKQDSYDVKGIILKIDQWGLRQIGECAVPSKGGLSPEAVRGALMVLFAYTNKEGKRLFSKANHWVAVFRVMVDEELVADNAFEVFAKYIDGLMIENVPFELNTNSLSHSYDGVYRRPLKDWSVEAYLRWKGTGAKTKIFDDMYEVATKFRSLLDERRKKTA